jgi:hypothetical protein
MASEDSTGLGSLAHSPRQRMTPSPDRRSWRSPPEPAPTCNDTTGPNNSIACGGVCERRPKIGGPIGSKTGGPAPRITQAIDLTCVNTKAPHCFI